jgi:hypothetical protein
MSYDMNGSFTLHIRPSIGVPRGRDQSTMTAGGSRATGSRGHRPGHGEVDLRSSDYTLSAAPGYEPCFKITPRHDHELARDCHDDDSSDTAFLAAHALLETIRESALWLTT